MDRKDAKASPTKSTTSSISSTTPTDDESITTSTESEAFEETWTLVTDKNNQQIKVAKETKPIEQDDTANDNQRLEILSKSQPKEEENRKEGLAKDQEDGEVYEEEEAEEALDSDKDHYGRKSDHDNTADDELSDGISIISESESAGGRSSPTLSSDRLNTLNLKINLGEHQTEEAFPRAKLNFPIKLPASSVHSLENENDNQNQLMRRRRRSGSQPFAEKHKKSVKPIDVVARFNEMPTFIRKGLSGLFYGGLIVACLAFIGRIRMYLDEGSQPQAQNLEQKVIDIEMQNNLMRAEIDLLTKQVNYLNNLNDPTKNKFPTKSPYQGHQSKEFNQKEKYEKRKEPNTFKAWSGNGDSLDPVEISKKDMKKPFHCPDGKYIQFGGMCIENPAYQKDNIENEKVNDPLASVVDNILEKTGPLKDFVKMAENINNFAENPFETLKESTEPSSNQQAFPSEKTSKIPPQQPQQHSDSYQTPPPPTPAPHSFQQEKWQQKAYKQNEQKFHKDFENYDKTKDFHPKQKDESKEHFNSEQKLHGDLRFSKEFHKKQDFNSKERFQAKHQNNFKERSHNHKQNNSRERFNNNEKSKERFDKLDHSKERFNKRKPDESKEGFSEEKPDGSKEYSKLNNRKDNYRKANSKEHFDRKPLYPSNKPKERYDSKENKHSKLDSAERRKFHPKDSDWHEQLMHHREEARRHRHEQDKNVNNWYIERGGSREQLRFR